MYRSTNDPTLGSPRKHQRQTSFYKYKFGNKSRAPLYTNREPNGAESNIVVGDQSVLPTSPHPRPDTHVPFIVLCEIDLLKSCTNVHQHGKNSFSSFFFLVTIVFADCMRGKEKVLSQTQ